MSWRSSSYVSSPILDISRLRTRLPVSALTSCMYQAPDCDEVYPGLFIGDAVAAKDKAYLKRMGITHVLNTAEGPRYTQVDTGHLYYRDTRIKYKGFNLMDSPDVDISKYFQTAADFINSAISSGGRVLVHCMMGVSRSATCALAYLMIYRNMSFTQAMSTVRTRRDICPNEGFIRQLQQLDRELRCASRPTHHTIYTSRHNFL